MSIHLGWNALLTCRKPACLLRSTIMYNWDNGRRYHISNFIIRRNQKWIFKDLEIVIFINGLVNWFSLLWGNSKLVLQEKNCKSIKIFIKYGILSMVTWINVALDHINVNIKEVSNNFNTYYKCLLGTAESSTFLGKCFFQMESKYLLLRNSNH